MERIDEEQDIDIIISKRIIFHLKDFFEDLHKKNKTKKNNKSTNNKSINNKSIKNKTIRLY